MVHTEHLWVHKYYKLKLQGVNNCEMLKNGIYFLSYILLWRFLIYNRLNLSLSHRAILVFRGQEPAERASDRRVPSGELPSRQSILQDDVHLPR